jgi:hypothetical protein
MGADQIERYVVPVSEAREEGVVVYDADDISVRARICGISTTAITLPIALKFSFP